MALGNPISEFKNKTVARNVRDTSANHVVMENTVEGVFTGKLAGMVASTASITQHADGTGVGAFKMAIMGTEGEMAAGDGHGLGVATPDGKINIRGILALHSEHPKWSWLNRTPIAFESVIDTRTGEETGRLLEWV